MFLSSGFANTYGFIFMILDLKELSSSKAFLKEVRNLPIYNKLNVTIRWLLVSLHIVHK
jgi:hypothetical protein